MIEEFINDVFSSTRGQIVVRNGLRLFGKRANLRRIVDTETADLTVDKFFNKSGDMVNLFGVIGRAFLDYLAESGNNTVHL